MNPFYEMFRKLTGSLYYDRMVRFIAPLKDRLGINHFWYYRITHAGLYSYVGTHAAWNEFTFERSLIKHFPCLRHPSILQSGIELMKTDLDSNYQEVLRTAWDKFQINLNLNLLKKTPEGVEAFGFGSHFNDAKADERLLNELPLLRFFAKNFRAKHRKLFLLLEDNQVNISSNFGSLFYERPKAIVLSQSRNALLRSIGLEAILKLTPREIEVLRFVANGYPASYIAKQLKLSIRTIENHLATIKGKLSCKTKIALIQKAQEVSSLGFFDEDSIGFSPTSS